MEPITREQLRNMQQEYVNTRLERLARTIVNNVKQEALLGKLYYSYLFNVRVNDSPSVLVNRLAEVLVGCDIVYAEPYISIRWN
jgi:hypothetical protein